MRSHGALSAAKYAIAVLLISFGDKVQASPQVHSGTGCLAVALPGILLNVKDARTGNNVLNGALLRVVDGAFTDSVRVPLDWKRANRWGFAHERPGHYVVSVERAGYKPWKKNVEVKKDACHVITVEMTAQLRPK